jgi:hypothetical protein
VKAVLPRGRALVEAVCLWIPVPFFAQWALRRGLLWTPQRLFWVALLMAWSAEQTLTERFDAARDWLKELFPHWGLGSSYSGFLQAMARWDKPLRTAIAKRLRRQMQDFGARYQTRAGWLAFAADGSRLECPRTAINQAELGCAGKKRTAPQLFLTSLWHMGTGLPWDYRIGPGTASELRHLEDMVPELPSKALVVADAGFAGYPLCRRLQDADQSFLIRVGSNRQLLRKLGYAECEGPSTVYLWPEDHQQELPLTLRLIVLRKGKQSMYLLTNVLDEGALPLKDAALLYEMRWGVEVFYRGLKQTLARRRLLSRTPEAAEMELAWAVMGMWLLGVMSVAAIVERGRDPLSWSVALARKNVRAALRGPTLGGPRLPELLAAAVKDNYQRLGSKKARDWPHKKREKPPGPPRIREATEQEVNKAKQLRAKSEAA